MSELADKLAKLRSTAVEQLAACGVSSPDNAILDTLTGRMKLIVDNKDATLVAGTDPSELETVRKNFVEKKLGITERENSMKVIEGVVSKMSAFKFKSRIAFYYLVQQELG